MADTVMDLEAAAKDAGMMEVPAPTPEDIQGMVREAAKKYGVPEEVALGVAHHESGFNPHAMNKNRNGTRDWGVMQLNDTTVDSRGVKDPLDPVENIDHGVGMLGEYWKKYNGDLDKTLWAYAAGPGSVEKGTRPEMLDKYVDHVRGYKPTPDVGSAAKALGMTEVPSEDPTAEAATPDFEETAKSLGMKPVDNSDISPPGTEKTGLPGVPKPPLAAGLQGGATPSSLAPGSTLEPPPVNPGVPLPPGLRPGSVPAESVNPELTNGTGFSPEYMGGQPGVIEQQKAQNALANRWGIPEISRKASPVTKEDINPELTAGTGVPAEELLPAAQEQADATRRMAAALSDAAIGLVSPKGLATVLAAEAGGVGLASLANSPRVVAALSKLTPELATKVSKALDIASKAAIPAAFSAQAGVSAVTAAQQGKAEDAIVNAIFALAGGMGAARAATSALETYPAVSPEVKAQAKQVGGIAQPNVSPGQAQATAEALEQSGQRLSAQAWRNLDRSQPIGLTINGNPAFLQPPQRIGKRAYHSITDGDGNVIVGGSAETVRGWLIQNRADFVAPVATASEMGGMPVPPIEKATSIQQLADGPVAGKVYELPNRKVSVREVGDDGRVVYDEDGPAGAIKGKRMPLAVFQKMVGAGAPAPQTSAPENSPSPAAGQPEPNGPVGTPGPAAASPSAAGPQDFQNSQGETVTKSAILDFIREHPESSTADLQREFDFSTETANAVADVLEDHGYLVHRAEGDGSRRVTGTAPIPLSKEGERESEETAQQVAAVPFTKVLTSPAARAIETAQNYGVPVVEHAFDPRHGGEHEGQPAEQVKDQIRDLILNPDRKAPGVSPLSGIPGESYHDFEQPMFGAIQKLEKEVGPEDRLLIVTHGGNLQAINAWAKAGKPADGNFDHSEMAKEPYWSAVGKLFRLDPDGLHEVKDNSEPGKIYFEEHGHTAFNPPKSATAETSKIGEMLGGATRNYKIGGQPMQEPDPRAQLILKSLSPEDQRQIDSLMADAQNPRVLSSGFDHVVIDLGNQKVMRLGRLPQHEADSPFLLKPVVSRTIGQVGVEIYPKVRTEGITDADVEHVQDSLKKAGLEWDDASKDNLGRDPRSGGLKIIDGQVKRSAQPEERQFSSTQFNLPALIEKAIQKFGASISANDLTEKGLERESHVTIKYGIHSDSPEAVRGALTGESPVTIKLGRTSALKTPEADILKLDVESPELRALNQKVGAAAEHTDTHPEYIPHVTIAYLKPGTGEKYSGKVVIGATGLKPILDTVTFSTADDQKTDIPLGKAPAAQAQQFKEGDKVTWTQGGKVLTGTITNVDSTEGTASIQTDQIAHIGGRIPILRSDTVKLEKLSPLNVPTQSKSALDQARDQLPKGQAISFIGAGGVTKRTTVNSVEDHGSQFGGIMVHTPLGLVAFDKVNVIGRGSVGAAPAPTTVPQVRREGSRFVTLDGEPVADISLTGNVNLVGPYANLTGANRNTLLGAIEHQLKNPEQYTPEAQRESGAPALADAVYRKLKNGETLGNVTDFNKLAEQYFGSPRTSGAWTPKDAFDAMEAGVNKHLLDRGAALLAMPYEQAMAELRDLMTRVTSQGTRTEEQDKFQQFSTPPTEAFTVAKVAALTPQDVALEPSAGNGGLAVWPKSIGAVTYANEISDRRRKMLEAVGFAQPSAHDGEVINALLDQGIRPTVIIMNPPFSAGGAKSGPAANKNKYGFNHVDSALQRLAPNGRLVAILGGGRADDPDGGATLLGSGPSAVWFQGLGKRYNVRANVRIHGREYQKYGTAFATRIIVIDKDGPTPSRMKAIPDWTSAKTGIAETLEQAYNLLRDVAESRPAIERPAVAGSQPSTGTGETETPSTSGDTRGLPSGRPEPVLPGRRGTSGEGQLGGQPGSARPAPGGAVNEPGPAGQRTDVRQPEPEPQQSGQGFTPGAAEGAAQNGRTERPLPNEPGDVAGGSGLTPQQIIDAITKRLEDKTGRKAAETTAPPQGLAPSTPPTAPPSKPRNAMSEAADEARQRLRDKLRKSGGEEPVRYNIEFRREPQPLDAETLIDLGAIGAEHILNGAVSYPDWLKLMTEDVGDLVEMLGRDHAQHGEDILRQVYTFAGASAKRFGVDSAPLPAPTPVTDQALDGTEVGNLDIERTDLPKSEQEDSDAYVAYQPTIKGPEHPGSIVETKTMATVPLPPITYRPKLPESVIKEGRLSAVQLEAISIAGQQNDTLLPDGSRASALIGDGTGVGKGREAAGILWDNWNQGRKRLVWVSVKWDLMQDAIRDLNGIGAEPLLRGVTQKPNGQWVTSSTSAVQRMDKYKYGDEIDHEGMLFSTYALIRSENKKGQRRVSDLEKYLKGEDDGEGAYIVWDECVPRGTMIATPLGERPIEQLRVGDEVLGFDHDTGKVITTTVSHCFHRHTTSTLIPVNRVLMTGNHPVWTEESGYIPSANLRSDHTVLELDDAVPACLRVVRETIYDQAERDLSQREGTATSILWEEVLCSVEDERPNNEGESHSDSRRKKAIVGALIGADQKSRLAQEDPKVPQFKAQSVLGSGSAVSGSINARETRLQEPQWGEREALVRSRALVVAEARMEARGDRSSETMDSIHGESNVLSCGHRQSTIEDSHRGGRTQPPMQGSCGCGSPQRDVSDISRVAGVEILESAGSDAHGRDCSAGPGVREVFNIETGSSNYFANKLLVHNCHTLKNAVVGQGGQASQIGVAVRELMRKIPKLRSVSLSATAATDVMNLGYLDRLGLWGPGTAFPTGFTEFASQIAGGRLAAMEMVARELKAQGKYLSRTLSFKGVTYAIEEHKVSDDQKELYATASKAWASVVQQIEHSIQTVTNGGGRQKARFMALFEAAQQRFFNLLITALKTPTAIELANKGLAEGKSVVITLVNTNEAAQNREKNKAALLEDEDEIPDYDFGPKQMLVDLIKEHYPVQQFVDDVDDAGNPVKRPLYNDDGTPINNPQAEAARDALVAEIDKNLHMPENPLDTLINSLGGSSQVAELTGRKERFDNSTGKFVPRGDPTVARKDVNILEMRNFQSGKKRVAILSAAADTGISLHAGLDVPNQQRRYHLTLQAGWSADKAMQMFGRTHRTNQAHPPEYVLLASDLGGEKRFLSTIARRLGSLGALTKGQKNATSGTDLMDKVNFETDQGKQAVNSFYEQLLHDTQIPGTGISGMSMLQKLRVLEGAPPTVPPRHRQNVTKFLNRLLALEPNLQNPTYNYFYDIFQACIERAIENGTLDTGVKTLPGDEFNVEGARSISKDPKTGAETFYYPVEAKIRRKRISPEDLVKRLSLHADENPVIMVRQDNEKLALAWEAKPIVRDTGEVIPASYFVTAGNGIRTKIENLKLGKGSVELNEWAKQEHENAIEKEQSAARSVKFAQEEISRYTRGGSAVPSWSANRLAEAQKALDAAKEVTAQKAGIEKDPMAWAKEQWGRQYEESPSHVSDQHHLLGGAVLRFWNPIQEASGLANIYTTVDSKTGQRVVGVDIPGEKIGGLIQRIAGGASTVNTRQFILDVLTNNLNYTLEGNVQVRRGRIGRDFVIQLIPANQNQAQRLKDLGAVYERGVVPVYYVPNQHIGPREGQTYHIVDNILKEYPIKPAEEPARYNRPAPGFYSQLERVIDDKIPSRGMPQQILATLNNPQNGVKAEEIEWSGLDDFLKDKKGPVTKQELLDYVRANNVQVEEVQHGAERERLESHRQELSDQRGEAMERAFGSLTATQQKDGRWDLASRAPEVIDIDRQMREVDDQRREMRSPKYSEYTLPGGKNYRELLLTLPVDQNSASAAKSARVKELIERRDRLEAEIQSLSFQGLRSQSDDIDRKIRAISQWPDDSKVAKNAKDQAELDELNKRWEEVNHKIYRRSEAERDRRNTITQIDMVMREPAEKSAVTYQSPHWEEPNVLAHVRFDDRTGTGGEKILHVAEIQSDWHQKGRTKGYRGERGRSAAEQAEGERLENKPVETWTPQEMDWYNRVINDRNLYGVAAAPFKTSWPELAFKRMLRYAAENGYDKLTWDTGETSADRYDLSKQIDAIHYTQVGEAYAGVPGIYHVDALKHGSIVASTTGSPSDLEEFIGKDVTKKIVEGAGEQLRNAPTHKKLSGLDLKVGGEGMKGFYDKILPDFARKYGKKWGAKVGSSEIPLTDFAHHVYEGTDHSLEEVDNAYRLSKQTVDMWNSPITGQRLMFPMTRVTVSDQLAETSRLMKSGQTFTAAMAESAAIYGDNISDIFGGKIRDVYNTEERKVHSIDITPSMRESVMQGQPLFQRANVTPINEGPTAEFRGGVLWVNPSMMERIADAIGGPKQVAGVYLPPRLAQDLPDRIGALGSVRTALRDAVAARRSVTVVVKRPGESLGSLKATIRHELFHASEIWAGPTRGNELLKEPAAQKAANALERKGYDRKDVPLIWSEIGAHLASGPVGWQQMDLNRQEAKDLFRRYLTLVDPETVKNLRHVAPDLNQELYAARTLNANRAAILQSLRSREAQPTEGSAGPGDLRPGVRERVSGEPARANREAVNRERGAIRMLSDAAQFLQDKFGSDAPRANYSGLGAASRIFMPGRGLADVEKASIPVFRRAIRAASSNAIVTNWIANAVPAIIKALKGSDVNWDQLRQYYTESRLRGIRGRWLHFADEAEAMTPEQYKQSMAPLPDGTTSPFINLLSKIEGRAGLNQNLAQTAIALTGAEDWETLRKLLAQSFNDAADHVATVMDPAEFDYVHDLVANDSRVREGDRLYGELIERPVAENHALNEGIFSDALGPANRYIPLVPFEREVRGGPGRRLPFHKPRNMANAFATGLSSGYDIGMETFAKRLSSAERANDKAYLIQGMRDTGWLLPESAGIRDEQGLSMEGPDGVRYKAVREEIGPSRTIIKDRKVIHTPARFGIMPVFMNRGLQAVLGREPMDSNEVIAVMRWANMLATKGPLELLFHSSGVMGALYANTPFLGKSGLDKALSLPILKWFTLRGKLLSADPTDPESVAKLRKMAEAGAVPERSGKITYSKKYAEETGAKRERLSFAPFLYGPKGLDARARVLMYDIFEAAYPNEADRTPEKLHHFVNQLGNYTPEMQGEIERGLKHIGLGPFATAGMTRIVNAISTFTGAGPGKGGSVESKIWWWLTSSALIAAGLYILMHKQLAGKYPWEDRRFKFMKIPVGGGNGYIDKFRHSKLGNALWGAGPEVGYVNIGWFDNPLVDRGARAMGISGALETKLAGGTGGQAFESAQRDILNSFTHPAMGPVARALFAGVSGKEPYLNDWRERNGIWSPQLLPAIREQGPRGAKQKIGAGWPALRARSWAAAKELNNFWVDETEHLGEFTGFSRPDVNAKGNPLVQQMFNLNPLTSGLVARPSNPFQRESSLRQQRSGTQ